MYKIRREIWGISHQKFGGPKTSTFGGKLRTTAETDREYSRKETTEDDVANSNLLRVTLNWVNFGQQTAKYKTIGKEF